MSNNLRGYRRIFGSGPMIALSGAVFLDLGHLLETAVPDFAWTIPASLRYGVVSASLVLATAVIVWSVRTLRPEQRGAELVTTGPFRYVRHPLYAACLSIFGPGLVIALGHPAYLLSLMATHLAAHRLIGFEEGLMRDWFPREYAAYCARTGRFIPHFTRRAETRPRKPGSA